MNYKFFWSLLFVVIAVHSTFAQYNLILTDNTNNKRLITVDIEDHNSGKRLHLSITQDSVASLYSGTLYGNYSRLDFTTALINTAVIWDAFADSTLQKTSNLSAIEALYEKILLTRLPLTQLNADRAAGVIQILAREIILVRKDKFKKIRDREKLYSKQAMLKTSEKNDDNITLQIDKVSFDISDNFICRITIDGYVIKGDQKRKVSIENPIWSLGLKDYHEQMGFVDLNDITYMFSYANIFIYKATENGAKSYHVQDAEFALKPFEEKVLLKRGLDQYLGVNVFTDFFGFYAQRPNNPLSVSFDGNFPLNLTQWRRFRAFGQANITLNSAVLNNFSGGDINGSIVRLFDTTGTSPTDTLMIDHFDLLRFQNFSMSGYIALGDLEVKEINTRFHLGVGAELYFSGFEYTEVTDSSDISNIYTIVSGAPFLNFLVQYRPDQFFGVNIESRIKYLTMLTSSNEIPQLLTTNGLYDPNALNQQKFNSLSFSDRLVFQLKIDAYAHVNQDGKSGIFAQLGTDLNTHGQIFPRVVVGYSTNLDAYINSVRTSN